MVSSTDDRRRFVRPRLGECDSLTSLAECTGMVQPNPQDPMAYRIASDDVAFVNRFLDDTVFPGIMPWFLTRFVGHAKATDTLLEKQTLSAREAHELGLVNRTTFPNNLAVESFALAGCFPER